ncbi:MAG: hypothetical protein LBK53_08650 [Heliobacteriaceae bacterium]|jgi:hypothetical protein|nr:hypothetical protein [Heliobacteriaceae bacterium]
MTNTLTKPYTNKQYAEFAIQANEAGKKIKISGDTVYALHEDDGEITGGNYEYATEQNLIRISEIKNEMEELDKKSTRCLRENALGKEEAELVFLQNIENQMESLRSELAQLNS